MTTNTTVTSLSQPKVWWKRHSIEEYVGGALLGVMVVVIFLQVIARYVFGDSFSWSEELARYCFIWLIYFTLGAVVLKAQHVTVDAVISRLPANASRWWEQGIQVVIFALNVLILIYGMILVVRMFSLGQTSSALNLPMWVVYTALPVGLLLASIRAVQASIAIWKPPPGGRASSLDEETEV
ncbi:TRAP transporter small permease [Citricoccus muralis]|uniref:TRAP transporter small permease n=1 Tax=Citricoccus muralis TaxID=169134 RepID=A0ABY8H995_9MICC|nr:TRAP transporter small permease [Citricoccus muralis]WFP17233.1 TRAP transporter small permease [Citricoccus muralis]